jgi:hypothetical protein
MNDTSLITARTRRLGNLDVERSVTRNRLGERMVEHNLRMCHEGIPNESPFAPLRGGDGLTKDTTMHDATSSNVYGNVCPTCGTVRIEDVLEPLVDAQIARLVIPYATMATLRTALFRHKAALSRPRYRRDESGRRHRLVSVSDIAYLRERAHIERGTR